MLKTGYLPVQAGPVRAGQRRGWSRRPRPKKTPLRRRKSGVFIIYLLRPEPEPRGVSVDPLGEGPAPIVLPDGFLEL
jgi:hypothetical protein